MADAVTQVIDNPLLLRIADLGTVVNVLQWLDGFRVGRIG